MLYFMKCATAPFKFEFLGFLTQSIEVLRILDPRFGGFKILGTKLNPYRNFFWFLQRFGGKFEFRILVPQNIAGFRILDPE